MDSTAVRNERFDVFTKTIVPMLSPELVVHSGDITDGWIEGTLSGEIEDEWKLYHSILEKNKLFNDTFWLDVRGNHDNTNLDSSTNHFYYNHSTCGKLGPVYNKIYEKPFGRYCFIGVDATLSPSPGIMMTYFGYVNTPSQQRMRAFLKQDLESCNHTILFYHYPTMYLNSPTLKAMYHTHPPSFILAGHVHTTMGSKANAKLNPSSLELVIRDFKFRYIYRLMVIDNDYLNYVDCSVDSTLTTPIIIVSNPPNSQYLSKAQKLEFQKYTRFIHIMAYDLSMNGTIQLDGFDVWIDNQQLEGTITASSTIPHLYYFPWNSSLYTTGLHKITVYYSNGKITTLYTHSFLMREYSASQLSQTNATVSYSTIIHSLSPGLNFGGYMLNSTFVIVLVTVAYSITLLLVFFMVVARVIDKRLMPHFPHRGTEGRALTAQFLFYHPSMRGYPIFFKRWLLLASDKPLYYFFIVSLLWQSFGIWLVGTFPTEFGIQFLWGTLFIPETRTGSYSLWLDTYIWHLFLVVFFWIPLLVYYCQMIVPEGVISKPSSFSRAVRGVAHCLWLAYYVGGMIFVKLYLLWDTYTPLTVLTSPVWCWFAVVNSVLMVREMKYQLYYMRKAGKRDLGEESLIVAKSKLPRLS